jgi:hypothetical protein
MKILVLVMFYSQSAQSWPRTVSSAEEAAYILWDSNAKAAFGAFYTGELFEIDSSAMKVQRLAIPEIIFKGKPK